MSPKYNKLGLTLVELILAILLVNVVILTGLSMEMGMRKIFTGTDFTFQLNNEGAAIMAFVSKKINKAIGSQLCGFPPYSTVFVANGKAWAFLQDTNGNGIPDPGVDTCCAFRWYDNTSAKFGELDYFDDVANILGNPTVVLTTHCFSISIDPPAVPPNRGYSLIKLRLRKNVNQPVSATNPEIQFITEAQYLCASFS